MWRLVEDLVRAPLYPGVVIMPRALDSKPTLVQQLGNFMRLVDIIETPMQSFNHLFDIFIISICVTLTLTSLENSHRLKK